MRVMLKSKIHRARVTGVDLDYEGSIAIDKNLMEAADILPYEQVHVVNVNHGARVETYAIEAEAGSGTIGIRGAAARLAAIGDVVIILTYRHVNEEDTLDYHPTLVYVDKCNSVVRTSQSIAHA